MPIIFTNTENNKFWQVCGETGDPCTLPMGMQNGLSHYEYSLVDLKNTQNYPMNQKFQSQIYTQEN